MAADPTDAQAELMQRFRNGDEDAFRQLFAQHLDRLKRRLARRIPPRFQRRFDVSDVIQETRLVAFARREDFEIRGPDAFGRWIGGIGDHKLARAIHRHGQVAKRSAHQEVTRGRRVDTAAVEAGGPTPSQLAVSHELEDRVQQALASLSADDQQVIRLTREAGMTLDEAAEPMGRSREAVRKLLQRALARFTAAYDAMGRGRDV
jgi:RNA polymerase sigma-70 factor (ECF subfamily)